MNSRIFELFVVALVGFSTVTAFFDPCQGRGSIGTTCDYDSDCIGFATICVLGVCSCHPYYTQRNDTDGSKFCVKAPDTINAPCTDSCQFPMFCSNGKCQCIRSIKQGNRCLISAALGDSCTKNYECALPFSACINGRCGCIVGSTQSGQSCVAAPHCPDGAQPKGNCIRFSSDVGYIQNQFNGSAVSTCPDGFFCYTSDVSLGGQCCPQMCPYSTQPESAYSCSPGASSPCPSDTHFCHRLAGQSFSSGVCCRRPCREPNPVFINGRCYPRAWLGSPCTINEQCEAADGMQCSSGVCVCKAGYKPQTGSFISSQNPPEQCIKDCGSSLTERDGDCFANVGLGQQCDVDDQCPSNSRCFRGTCYCKCDLGYTKSAGSCVILTTTTAKPAAGVTSSIQGGFLGLVSGLLKGGGFGG